MNPTATQLPIERSATGAWHPALGLADRNFAELGAIRLEAGDVLESVTVAYETFGTRATDDSNIVLVEHALTGDAHAAGEGELGQTTPGWWDGVIGPGKPIDTNKWFVVCANVLGGCQGTTGPAANAPDGKAYGSRWPRITIRDQVRVEALLARKLGIRKFAAVIGGSMGGMRALEWAATYPERVGVVALLATAAAASADQIGTQTAQIIAITNDSAWNDGDYYEQPVGPTAGLGLARRLAHLTYRSESELESRFGRRHQTDGEDPLYGPARYHHERETHRYSIQSYLDHHAEKLNRRFDAGSYVALTDAMNSHDLGRGRGGVVAALKQLAVPVFVAGIDSDRLYPLWQQQLIADNCPNTVRFDVIHSQYGHDGFLIESEAVGRFLQRALAHTEATS